MFALADNDRQSADLIAGGDDRAVLSEDQHRRGTVDHILGKFDALHKIAFLVDQRREQLCRVDPAAGHRVEVTAGLLKIPVDQLGCVVDDTDVADGIGAEMRADQHRLRVAVGDHTDRGRTAHLVKNMLKFGTEGRVFDVMDLALQSDFFIIRRQTSAARSEVRMIVNAEEHIHHAVFVRGYPEKSTHILNIPPGSCP